MNAAAVMTWGGRVCTYGGEMENLFEGTRERRREREAVWIAWREKREINTRIERERERGLREREREREMVED